MNNKKIMDERQEIINKNMLIRSFGVLSILLIMSIIYLISYSDSPAVYEIISIISRKLCTLSFILTYF